MGEWKVCWLSGLFGDYFELLKVHVQTIFCSLESLRLSLLVRGNEHQPLGTFGTCWMFGWEDGWEGQHAE